jgi:hypothetical protein
VEQRLLQPHFQELTAPRKIEDIMERTSSRRAATGIDVSRIAQIFQGRRQDNLSSTQVWIFGTLVSLIISLILILIYEYIKLKPQPCTPPSSRLFSTPSKAVPVPTTSVKNDSIELQILTTKQAENADMTEDIPERGQQQTRFVQHGTLPADA